MKLTPNMFPTAEEFNTRPPSVDLRRIDPSLNMRRFYRMSLQPDLFGGVDVVREWGRIGSRGQSLIERHSCEDEAVSSMLALETAKRRRGYRPAG
ncbi:WGR domain-containing protein [Marinovum algicola]|uniref:WGR domain-containing protein n=1 Tax=Marinovum algicola TaxID=42444 RepID=UPI0011139324|nr:WGR domain-containing protein [Marinovum algicola]